MPAEYPITLVRQHRLSDGRTVVIRPIRRADDVHEQAFLKGLSEETWYLRFHKWITAPSEKLVHFLTDIDYDTHMAFVCTVQRDGVEEVVGEARYAVSADGKSCDFGIMLADAWHRSGVAGLLMAALVEAAQARGLRSIEGIVLARNVAMLRFARGLGFEVQSTPDDPETKRIVKKL